MTTVEQKAKDLVIKYYSLISGLTEKFILLHWYSLSKNTSDDYFIIAKQCALISIDEVLENVNYFFIELEKDGLPNKFTDEIEYWEVVKEEISKLLPA